MWRGTAGETLLLKEGGALVFHLTKRGEEKKKKKKMETALTTTDS